MSKKNYDPVELREEIADEVIRLYQQSSINSGWADPPKEVMQTAQRIYELVTKAVGLEEEGK